MSATLLELDPPWLPVSITRDGRSHHGSYAIDDGSIVVVFGGRTVSTWVAPTTDVRTLAKVLLGELTRAARQERDSSHEQLREVLAGFGERR